MRQQQMKSIVAALSAWALVALPSSYAADYKNIFGSQLSSCSSDGMALTGYTRNGYCVDQNDDAGSHHICIDMTSTAGGDFCSVTGQSNWCSSEMPCHEDRSLNCQIQHWCVCQWAFASYIQKAGGCDAIQDVVCDAINAQALIAYKQQASGSQKYQDALDCLMQKCGVEGGSSNFSNILSMAATDGNKLQVTSSSVMNFAFLAAAVAIVVGAVATLYQRRSHRSRHSDGTNENLIYDERDSTKICAQ